MIRIYLGRSEGEKKIVRDSIENLHNKGETVNCDELKNVIFPVFSSVSFGSENQLKQNG